jgi:hypothetical protein
MKVTIINNGTTSVVLKPETEEEVLALKKLGKENVSITHHEKLQIMTEPVPNALVISIDKPTE